LGEDVISPIIGAYLMPSLRAAVEATHDFGVLSSHQMINPTSLSLISESETDNDIGPTHGKLLSEEGGVPEGTPPNSDADHPNTEAST
jgi:hypothetical protein